MVLYNDKKEGILMNKFNSVEEAIEDIKNGKMVVVVDDEHRENEGDLVMAAQTATPESVNFMASQGKGLICCPMSENRAKELSLGLMVETNQDKLKTAFTISVDHINSTTGISAFERAKTISELANKNASASDFIKPGHIFPLIGREGGVLSRAGHTEASIDLARLAGLEPVGCICEIMNEDGEMARVPELFEFAEKFNLKFITIESIIKYRGFNEKQIQKSSESSMPTKFGDFKVIVYENTITNEHHVALVKGDISKDDSVLVRVHSECLTGDAFHSLRCDCGEQLEKAMKEINKLGKGIILYMRQEGRGIGLVNKLKAYELQDQGKDTVEANVLLGFAPDLREYGIGAQILYDLNVRKIRLLTNNPRKIVGLAGYGLEVVERVPLQICENDVNKFYLKTKETKMGHLFKRVK